MKYRKNPEAVSCLTPEQYRVTQEDGAESPFTGERRFRTVESIEEGLRDERLQQVSFALG